MIFLIAHKGPILALIVMIFVRAMTYQKGAWVLILIALVLACIGYQFRESGLLLFKEQLFKKETALVRMELYYIGLDVMKEKPVFGLGFNTPFSRFVPYDYKPRVYPQYGERSFFNLTRGVEVFDSMALSFVAEMGGLFTLAYLGLFVYVLRNINLRQKGNINTRTHASLILIVIAGFFIHSLTFDSLKYIHLNWMFHSLLAMMARSQGFDQKKMI